jgi:glycosyltransferase involved in cell wall biosynthesis
MTAAIPPDHVLVVIPAYNEGKNIGGVVRSVKERWPGLQVLVVDDGSTDDTYRIAREHGAVVARLPFNLGIGVAVQTGIKYAREHDFRWMIRLDGDGQHNSADIAIFLEFLGEHEADLLIGSRFLKKEGFRSSLLRRVAITFFNHLISALTGFRITDATSGFRVYSRRAMDKLCKFYPDDYPEPETIIMLYKWGMQVREVPVTMLRRPEGVSSITAVRSLYYVIKVTMAILLDMIRY